MPEIVAFHDHRVFGALPYPGGTMNQPAWLMDGMRMVASVVAEHEAREAAKQQRKQAARR